MNTHTDQPISLERAGDDGAARIGRAFVVWMLVLTAVAAGLRLHELGSWGVWEDELYSVRSAMTEHLTPGRQVAYWPIRWSMQLGGADLDAVVHPDTREFTAQGYPPADDWRAANINEWNMRLVTAVTGIVSVPVLMFFSVRLLGVGGASVLGLLLTFSPWHVFWSQASRFYVQQFLFYNLALIFYFTATQRGSTARFVVAGATLVVALLTQPPALLIGLVFVGDYLWGLVRRDPPRITTIGWALMGVAAVAVGFVLYRFVVGGGFDYWSGLGGHSPQMIVLGTIYRNEPIIAAAAGLAVLALWRSHTRLVPYLVMGAALPVVVLVAMAMTPELYSHTRYAFIVHFCWLALAAMGLARLYEAARPTLGRIAAATPTALVATALMFNLFLYFTEGYGNRARWAEALEYAREHRAEGEAIASERVLIGTYYLETTDLAPFPYEPDGLEALDRPTWLVTLMGSARDHERFPHVHREAELREYFDVRVAQPFSSVRVYYYDPGAQASDDESAAETAGDGGE